MWTVSIFCSMLSPPLFFVKSFHPKFHQIPLFQISFPCQCLLNRHSALTSLPSPSSAFFFFFSFCLLEWFSRDTDQYLQKEAHILQPIHSPLSSSSFLVSFLHCLCSYPFIHQTSAEHTHSMSPGRGSTWSPSCSSQPVCHQVLLHPAPPFRIYLLILDHSRNVVHMCKQNNFSSPFWNRKFEVRNMSLCWRRKLPLN